MSGVTYVSEVLNTWCDIIKNTCTNNNGHYHTSRQYEVSLSAAQLMMRNCEGSLIIICWCVHCADCVLNVSVSAQVRIVWLKLYVPDTYNEWGSPVAIHGGNWPSDKFPSQGFANRRCIPFHHFIIPINFRSALVIGWTGSGHRARLNCAT